ncbi:MAG: hypothetical protein Q9208_000499 [Pyrenodesmia sp. 3 TL-2023]
MPLNTLFRKPSTTKASSSSSSSQKAPIKAALNSNIFPSSSTTYTLIRALLLSCQHPSLRSLHPSSDFHQLEPIDVQQLLTEIYGFEPSLHWTWIGCTFPASAVDRGLRSLEQKKLPRSQRRALVEFCTKTQADEKARMQRILTEQGRDGADAYADEKKRRRAEIDSLERCMRLRKGTL